MGFSLARLTLYGTIAALDEDLRNIVKSIPVDADDKSRFYGTVLFERLKERADRDPEFEQGEYADYLDMGDAIALLGTHKHLLFTKLKNFVDKNIPKLIDLIIVRNRVMHSRPIHYADVSKVDLVCGVIRNSVPSAFPNTVDFLTHVVEDPYFPFTIDVSDIETNGSSIAHNLPLPDFDETGFLGREAETAQLVAACKGPWPIITVVGEGGYGKTALALQASYELLDDPSKPFEFVVWTSSKTTRLALHEVEEIENAISNSIGLFQDVSQKLTGVPPSPERAVDEVLGYLNSFKILLVIDNLETVLDENILNFFSRLNGNSKILVTSRVGTGEMNFRFPLGPLSVTESVRLLRATAKARRVPEITRSKDADIAAYCRRMKNNPGFIKWFVSAVQSGRRPEDALVDPKVFLDFCVSNVYQHVGPNARKLASVMLSVPGRHSQSVLSFISEISGDEFKRALQELWSANIVTMLGTPTAAGYQTVYELSELPRLFILKNYPPSKSDVRNFQSRKRKIGEIYKQHFARPGINKYVFTNIGIRTSDDTVVARYLMDALQTAQDAYERALSFVEKAKELDPGFYEVYRVEAIVHRAGGNFPAAVEAYETAVACEPSSAPLRYWYAGFLMRDADDIATAAEQFRIARELDPGSPQVALEYARCLMFGGDYAQADAVLKPILSDTTLPVRTMRKVQHLGIKNPLRHLGSILESGLGIEKLELFCRIRDRFLNISTSALDEQIANTVRAAKSLSERVFDGSLTLNDDRFEECGKWFRELDIDGVMLDAISTASAAGPTRAEINLGAGLSMAGTIAKYDFEKHYGFVELDRGNRIFFHRSDFRDRSEQISVGSRVAFVVALDGGRNRATELVVIHEDGKEDKEERQTSQVYTGIVKTYLSDKGFGFIYGEGGNELFFHKNNVSESQDTFRIFPGERVNYILGRNQKGICADQIRLVD